ncbi:hypothetical protein RNZ50_09730 [Paracoccaceae bacterium Fryx2]|nr:hypothetical protein [Paracoccaceae bacterium Fryx2]
MSKSTQIILSLCMVAFVAGCAAKKQEVVYVDEPVTTEPVYTGKYK